MPTTQLPLGIAYAPLRYATDAAPDVKRAAFRARKVLAGIVHDATALEGNPFTFPEVQTLLDGVTVGGRKVADANQVLNQHASWLALLDDVEAGAFVPSAETALRLQGLVAREEALAWGCFRTDAVGIGGTAYEPPPHAKLPALFDEMVAALCDIDAAHEKAGVAFLTMAAAQFFWDGNKRTGRLIMNGLLLSAGYDAITVPAAKRLEFNKKMTNFYDTLDATEMMRFLAACSLDKTLRVEGRETGAAPQ